MILDGAASGANFAISGNSFNTLSGWLPFGSTPSTGDSYAIFYDTGGLISGTLPSGYVPPFGRNYIQCSVGYADTANTAIRETGIVLSGRNSLRLYGMAVQDFQVPISGGSATTLQVYSYYDQFYTGIKPQLIIINGTGVSVADTTGTMVGASGQWEKIALTFTATGTGQFTARLQSNTSGIGGSCYFDAMSIG
jgi:hypothetical protein